MVGARDEDVAAGVDKDAEEVVEEAPFAGGGDAEDAGIVLKTGVVDDLPFGIDCGLAGGGGLAPGPLPRTGPNVGQASVRTH